MERYKVLVADDDSNVREILRIFFAQHDLELVEAADGIEALEQVESHRPDIIVLDLMMPRMDGYDACREILKKFDIPIIMLTAKSDEFDKVLGLELGADDYVTKPFSPRELMSRIKAILRRIQRSQQPPAEPVKPQRPIYDFGELLIDGDRREIVVAGEKPAFRPKEFDLLLYLASSPGMVFTRDQLLEQVWGYDYIGDIRTVDVHITKLREKLSSLSCSYIHTVWGVGYKFEVLTHD